MTTKMIAALAALILAATSAQASPTADFDRHNPIAGTYFSPAGPRQNAKPRYHRKTVVARGERRLVRVPGSHRRHAQATRRATVISFSTQIVEHPAGCPRTSFCGCGAALEVFGRNIREAWLAAWWFRFPKAQPAPGMVAVRSHHVFVIRKVIGDGLVLAYDANSGGHRTRVWVRRLAGFSVRDPHGRVAMN